MKCVICRGDSVEKMNVEEEIKVENDIVFAPLDVLVCRTCGERYYGRATLRKLESMEEQLKKDRSKLRKTGFVLHV